jgi:hypothetical protein
MSDISHPQNGRPIKLSLSDSTGGSGQSYFLNLPLKPHNVAILHPSLGCPVIATPGADLRIFLIADSDFQSLFDSDPDTEPIDAAASTATFTDTDTGEQQTHVARYYKRSGPRVKAVINRLLKMFPWNGGKAIADVPLYPDAATAIANIEVVSLGDVNGFRDGRLHDKDRKLFALLRDSTRDAYRNLGAQYLFQVDMKPGAMSKPPSSDGLYDLAWLLPDPEQPKSLDAYAEPQDRATQAFIQNNRVNACLAGLPYAYLIDGKEFTFKIDNTAPIQNRHPVLITSKPKLNLGHLTDVHVSSRQSVFQKSTAQVLQDVDPKTGFKQIGKLVNVSYDTLKDLLDQMASDANIDALVLTGDLIDFNRNLDPLTMSEDWTEHFATPGNLWEAMHRDHHQSDRYPGYIDDLIVYSLIADFCRKGKPVFMVSGNHEAYELPYGISPRVVKPNPLTPAGVKRANEGIPADHNLTIYEALLLYGPEYHVYHKAWNFDKSRLPWFYTVFTPFTDYCIQHQDQCFVGLGWGDDEDIFGNPGGGVLPRSTRSLTGAQKDLVEQATQTGSERLLFTHFTLASYSPEIGLKAAGKIDCNDHLKKFSDYEQGSFKENRKALYGWIGDNKFIATLSGHSHRAALYEPRYDGGVFRDTLHTVGFEIGHEHDMALPFQNKPALIVSGCGGPVGVQNHYDPPAPGTAKPPQHLKGYGLDWPSGTRIQLNGGLKLKRILPRIDNVSSAQPRFAVAMDFFDLLEEPVFVRFESETDDGPFNVEINRNLPGARFVEGMALFARAGNEWKKFEASVTDGNPGSLTVNAPIHEDEFQKKVIKKKNPVVFLAVTFNSKLGKTTGYTQYNFNSPWLFRVDVKQRQEPEWVSHGIEESYVMVDRPGYVIARHGKHGEIPDFAWYNSTFDYQYPRADDLE